MLTKFLIRLLLFTLIIFQNCSPRDSGNEIWIDEFPESNQVKVDSLMKFDFLIPERIHVSNSKIFLTNNIVNEFLHVLDIESLKFVDTLAFKGDGPNEYRHLAFFRRYSSQNNDVVQYLFDWERGEVSSLNFDKENKSYTLKKEELEKEFLPVSRMVYYSNNLKIGVPVGDEENGRFKVLRNTKQYTVNYLPELNFKINPENKYPIYVNVSSGVQEDLGVFVSTSSMLGQFDFFDFDGNYLYSSIIERNPNLKNASKTQNIFAEPVTFYHSEIIPLKDSFFSLFGSLDIQTMESSNTRVFEFDRKGNPIREYKLDRLVGSFSYDQEQDCFYGLAMDMEKQEEVILVKWDR